MSDRGHGCVRHMYLGVLGLVLVALRCVVVFGGVVVLGGVVAVVSASATMASSSAMSNSLSALMVRVSE